MNLWHLQQVISHMSATMINDLLTDNNLHNQTVTVRGFLFWHYMMHGDWDFGVLPRQRPISGN